ncbi:MAG: PAS domain-containing protein [Halobacterium sp.]
MSDSTDRGQPAAHLRAVAAWLYDDAPYFAGVLRPDGTLVYANDTARSLVDAEPASLYGERFWETPWWSHDDAEREQVRERVRAAAGGERQQFETTHAATGGDRLNVELDLRPLTAPPAVLDGGDVDADSPYALAVTGTDASERASLAAAKQANLAALEGLYETVSDPDLSFDERVRALLRVGKDHLDLGEAFYTKIDGGVQLVQTSVADHPLLQEGEKSPLEDSYCKRTIEEGTVVMNAVGDTAFAADSAFDTFGLECYVGAKLELDGTVHGTICFADTEPRPEPIDATERAFVQVLAEWLNHELEQERARRRLARQNDRLERFTDVVSHDLRSPLNVASGHLDLASSKLGDGEVAGHVADAADALDRMTELVEAMRRLAAEGEVVGETERVSLAAVARDAAATALPQGARPSRSRPPRGRRSPRTANASAPSSRTCSRTRPTTAATRWT